MFYVVRTPFIYDACSLCLRDNESGTSILCTKLTSRRGLGSPSRMLSKPMQYGGSKTEGVEYFMELWAERKSSFLRMYAKER